MVARHLVESPPPGLEGRLFQDRDPLDRERRDLLQERPFGVLVPPRRLLGIGFPDQEPPRLRVHVDAGRVVDRHRDRMRQLREGLGDEALTPDGQDGELDSETRSHPARVSPRGDHHLRGRDPRARRLENSPLLPDHFLPEEKGDPELPGFLVVPHHVVRGRGVAVFPAEYASRQIARLDVGRLPLNPFGVEELNLQPAAPLKRGVPFELPHLLRLGRHPKVPHLMEDHLLIHLPGKPLETLDREHREPDVDLA